MEEVGVVRHVDIGFGISSNVLQLKLRSNIMEQNFLLEDTIVLTVAFVIMWLILNLA